MLSKWVRKEDIVSKSIWLVGKQYANMTKGLVTQ